METYFGRMQVAGKLRGQPVQPADTVHYRGDVDVLVVCYQLLRKLNTHRLFFSWQNLNLTPLRCRRAGQRDYHKICALVAVKNFSVNGFHDDSFLKKVSMGWNESNQH